MGYAFYSFLILIAENSDASLDKLKAELKDFYKDDKRKVKLSLSNKLLTLTINGWNLYVRYCNEGHVKEESAQLADDAAMGSPQKNNIAACAQRFEMSADPDPGMEYFNDSLFVQEKIEYFKNVYVYDSNAGTFLNI